MKTDSELARSRLQRAARAKDAARCARWLTFAGTVTLLALVTFAALDYRLLLPLPWRHATSALLAMTSVLGAWGFRHLFRRPTSLKEAALDTESLRPENDCVVSTAAEYASGKSPAHNLYEPELAAALQTVAAQRLGTVRTPYGRTLRGPLSILGVALATFVAFVSFNPAASTALKRVALPWLDARYTRVQVQPQNVEVPVGSSMEIGAVFSGRPPQDPALHWQSGGTGAWHTASLTRGTNGTFVHRFAEITNLMIYRVAGGDALSPVFEVTAYTPPELKHLSLGVAYPEYTQLKPVAPSAPDFTVLRGSTVTLLVRANVDLSRARVQFSDTNLPPQDLERGADGVWTGRAAIGRDTDYRIELVDRKGRRGPDGAIHHIVATPDQPPRVEILEPGQDMRTEATNRIPVRVSVADDYGVAEIHLVYHKLNGAEQRVPCPIEAAQNGEWIATATLDLSKLGLTRYEVVAYHVEAKDNNTLDGPGVGRSPLYYVEVTDQQSGPTPLLPPMPGEQVNLVVVQKQILADTVALTPGAPSNNSLELAERQTNAVILGRMYLATMTGAPPEAVAAMNSAVAAMDQAILPLTRGDRRAALPPEEAALAHLYRVLALSTNSPVLAVKPPPALPKDPKPKTAVTLREIKKPAPELTPPDPELEKALAEARNMSEAQAELTTIAQKLAKAESRGENAAPANEKSNQPTPAAAKSAQGTAEGKGPGEGDGDGKGEGKGKGKGDGKGQGEGQGEDGQGEAKAQGKDSSRAGDPDQSDQSDRQSLNQNTNAKPALPRERADGTPSVRTNSSSSPIAQALKAGSTGSTNLAPKTMTTVSTPQPRAEQPRSNPEARTPRGPNVPTPPAQSAGTKLARAKRSDGQGAKPGKGRGKGQGKAGTPGPKAAGKGQGAKPGDGSGKPSSSTQLNAAPSETAGDPQEMSPETAEALAEKQEELSAEARALGEMLRRMSGQGKRVGHNLAVTANQAAEHMEGAARALQQGNASGAGRRGTLSSAELDHLVTELERILGARPGLSDVSSEEAPKEYEAFISEYFRKLSYEK